MKIRNSICLVLFAFGAAPALAQTAAEKVTVSSLLAQDYAIAGTSATPSGGAGLFLRKGAKLYFCFVSETRQSATVATEYCKPVE
ncbi:hypothetical protein [Bradyrhizobium sp. JYMT SZCCT0180]|uniref:hypothetical protein n=1 Tax=Bradyrhizobium sp. JYMT SZCCT0180 TaxID=2807666 RepID=UPI001BAC4D4C|nr:hypothetical protein [Bradyrhizobium sp. JYMT SZCCT0180]MBR1215786.1 hypothetical protein [Bradyrhizobium sp. JYMT SZCCT0180]